MSGVRKQSGGFRVTERDLGIIRWLGRVKLATADQVRVRMGMGRTKAYDRLAGLVDQGLLAHERPVPGHGVYLASKNGLKIAGLELAPATVSLGALAHDLAVAGVVAELEARVPRLQLRTEREIRAHVQQTGDLSLRPQVSQRGTRDSRHWPDLALLTGSADQPGWLAVEVELSRKGARLLRAILAGYRRTRVLESHDRVLWGVLYLVPDQHDAQRLTRLAAEEDLGRNSYPVTLLAQRLDEEGAALAALRAMVSVHNVAEETHRRESQQAAARQAALDASQAAERAVNEKEWASRAEAAQASRQQAEELASRRSSRLFGTGRGR
jgi:hypothetical protein